jgi:serine/threonine protein phosphatase PrpC
MATPPWSLSVSSEAEEAIRTMAQRIYSLRGAAARHIQQAYRSYRGKIKAFAVDLKRLRAQAATYIQAIARGRRARKDIPILKVRHKDRILRWTRPAQQVLLAGTFTCPPWALHVRMKHSKLLDMHYSACLLEARLETGSYYFKFCVDGVWVCSDLYPVVRDYEGNINNCVVISGERKQIPRANSAKLLDSEVHSKDFAPQSLFFSDPAPLTMQRAWSGILDSPVGKDFRQTDGFEVPPLRIRFAAFMAAHPKSRSAPLSAEGSADRYFIDESEQMFGLADGVGEWQTFGLDAGLFPSELMESARQSVLSRILELEEMRPEERIQALVHCLHQANQSTRSFGSSTAMLALIKDNSLHIIYIGDSSFIVLRKRENTMSMNTVYRSMEQQHSFNCPFQLANLPKPEDYPGLLERGMTSLVAILKKSNPSNQDSALDARTEVLQLHLDDIIIAGSDGLFDNLYDSDITRIVQSRVECGYSAQQLAQVLSQELASKAVEKGWDPMYRSPFAKTAQRAGKRFNGGKLDDTTVVVGVAEMREVS